MPGAFSRSSAEPPSGAFAEGEAFLAERRRKGGTLYREHGVASRAGSASGASGRARSARKQLEPPRLGRVRVSTEATPRAEPRSEVAEGSAPPEPKVKDK